MSVSLNGDWSALGRVFDGVAGRIESESGRELGRSLATIERVVIDHVDAQDLDWDELDPAYAKKKEEKGLSPDVLRASNQMVENITTDQPSALLGMVGVQRGVMADGGEEEVVDIAIIHEQPDDDGKKVTARKLWKPSYDELKDELGADFCSNIVSVFKK